MYIHIRRPHPNVLSTHNTIVLTCSDVCPVPSYVFTITLHMQSYFSLQNVQLMHVDSALVMSVHSPYNTQYSP